MHTLFSVGELAKLCHLSKQTLIFYDKKGVLKPRSVDAKNGYRYYSVDQLEILDSILILKELGLSLNEIKAFMEERSRENALTLLQEQMQKNNEKINHFKLISKRLERKIEGLMEYCPEKREIEIFERHGAELLAVEAAASPGSLLQLDLAIKRLLLKAEKEKYLHSYQIGAMIPVSNILCGKYTYADYAFVPVESNQRRTEFHEMPEGYYVRGYHRGTYQEIGTTYAEILKNIREMGWQPYGYSYEYCVLDSLTSISKEDYVTEIQIPVERLHGQGQLTSCNYC